jgi:hypothetical protein
MNHFSPKYPLLRGVYCVIFDWYLDNSPWKRGGDGFRTMNREIRGGSGYTEEGLFDIKDA